MNLIINLFLLLWAVLLLSVDYLLVSLYFRRTFWHGYSFTLRYSWTDTWYV